ncbi:MAG TPA: NUDIX domain-containing protein [Candidatus Saccharimonadales bacterium]|nr:NUDIX domain-containing protein [Candidatus Saccharimonadales bacterium]
MPHIHTEPGQHDHTISIHIFRVDFGDPKVMLHFHRKINKYAQFGGHIELNETPWQATSHELTEETGYGIDQLQLLQPLQPLPKMTTAIVHPFPVLYATMRYPGEGGHYHTDTTYAFIATDEPRRLPAEGESTDIKLFSRQELVDLGEDKVDHVTREAALYIFDNCLVQWQKVSPLDFK